MIALPPILYRDRDIAILNKPAGVAVHPGPRTPHSLEDALPALQAHMPPVFAHRLDRDTSGCLAVGLSRRGVKALAAAFAGGGVEKIYWAILSRLPAESSGLVSAPLAKTSSRVAGWRMVVATGGQKAVTRWHIIDQQIPMAEFRPETGRTHQIRVHAAHIGCPIAGDPVYGDGAGPMRLHARSLAITLPDGRVIRAEAPLPPGWPAAPGPESR